MQVLLMPPQFLTEESSFKPQSRLSINVEFIVLRLLNFESSLFSPGLDGQRVWGRKSGSKARSVSS